ncbi:MAG: CcdB family protein, partial [Betaproteobacteria bacterium]|nr:CcdB family protein [Betaproteobacteria bacterium]
MAQFDVYLNPNPGTRKSIPYLLDVQADLLDTLATRVVVPLILAEEMGLAAKHLNPQFKIKGVAVVMSTAELAGIPNRSLGDKFASLKSKRDEIIA